MSDGTDVISYYVEELEYHGKSGRTREAYARVLREFESFLGKPPDGADRRDCMAWVHSLRADHAPSTVASYASYLHRFYEYMTRVGELDSNPMTVVREEMDESIDSDPTRRDLSVAEIRTFLRDVSHPLDRALLITLLKSGMRVGELCNLDLQDCNLPEVSTGETRAQLVGRGPSLFVASDIARGTEVNGETRTASNKRKRDTVVPVDGELRSALVRWLRIRPDPLSPADPLFLGTTDRWGRRATPSMVRSTVRTHAERAGWYRAGDGEGNVTPHYFRHFFTTHLRDRTGDRGIVKYLRGDVAGDVIDTYTHNWGDRVRETYLEHMYSIE